MGNPMELGRRILFKGPATRQAAAALLADRPLKNLQPLALDYWVVEAPDAWIACEQAQELARLPSVSLCHPVQRPFLRLQSIQAPAPNDPYFHRQWHLENRDTNSGARLGADIQARAAWTQTRGDGVAVAVVDDGVQMTHPDLADRFGQVPNVNFEDGSNNAAPGAGITVHATAVAGLIAASQSNRRGISGVAPKASLGSWVIFDQRGILAPDAVEMSQMFQAHSNQVHVQNHSWGTGGTDLYPLPPLEADAIGNAVTHGRQGRGVVLVRAASNFRHIFGDANADGYATDPRVITVAAARSDGRVANYS
ncbi:MAG: hypothetical protein FJ405_01350, partial [Verrucomicrobia bacterium]|nr:hypothetical protein [Verrucomicrobiota bacterium]